MNLLNGYPVDYFVFESIIWIFVLLLPFFIVVCFTQKKFSQKKKWGIAFFLFFAWSILLYASFIAPRNLKTKEFSIRIENLPHLRLVLISDLHVGPYKKDEWVRKVVTTVNDIHDVDAVFFLGDFVYGGAERYAQYLEPLHNLRIEKKFAVLGNHDHDSKEPENTKQSVAVSASLQKHGIEELKNKNYWWPEKGIWIIGVDDNYFGYDDLFTAFQNTEGTIGKILMAHSPDIMDKLGDRYTPDFVFSGHTHAGQIQLPWLGAIPGIIPTRNGKSLEAYLYLRNNIPIFISPGVGEVGPRTRLFNSPEIIVFTIN